MGAATVVLCFVFIAIGTRQRNAGESITKSVLEHHSDLRRQAREEEEERNKKAD